MADASTPQEARTRDEWRADHLTRCAVCRSIEAGSTRRERADQPVEFPRSGDLPKECPACGRLRVECPIGIFNPRPLTDAEWAHQIESCQRRRATPEALDERTSGRDDDVENLLPVQEAWIRLGDAMLAELAAQAARAPEILTDEQADKILAGIDAKIGAWVCGRCGISLDGEPATLPFGWARIMAYPDDHELCPRCVVAFGEWLDQPARERRRSDRYIASMLRQAGAQLAAMPKPGELIPLPGPERRSRLPFAWWFGRG